MDLKQAIYGLAVAGALTAGYTGVVSEGYRDQVTPGERVELRTERMKVFPGATAREGRARVYPGPRHWPEVSAKGDTAWREIDPEVKPKPWLRRMVSDKPYEITAGPWTAELSDRRPEDYRLSAGDDWIEFRALHDTLGIEAHVEAIPEGLKETLVLRDEKAATTLTWEIVASGKLGLAGNAVTVEGSDIRVSAPVAWDAKGKPVVVGVSLAGDTLRYAVDVAGAEWPVYVDPTATVTAESNTTGYTYFSYGDWPGVRYFEDGATDANALQVGVSLSYNVMRSHLALDMSGFDPDGKLITGISLKLYGQTDNSTTDFNVTAIASYVSGSFAAGWHNDFYGWSSNSSDTYSVIRYGTFYTSSFTTLGYNSINFLSYTAGRDSAIAHMGAGKPRFNISLLGEKDITPGSAPGSHQAVTFRDESGGAEYAPYMEITWVTPDVHDPIRFRLTPISGELDSLAASWTNNHSASIDSLKLGRVVGAGDTTWTLLGSVTSTSARVGGLNPYTKYTYFVRADSAGYYGYSNADDMWTTTELSRIKITVNADHGIFPTNTAVYDSARGETLADSLTDRSYPIYAIGQSAGSSATRGRVNRVSLMWLPINAADLLYPVRACTTLVYVSEDSTATDFSVRQVKGVWRGSGTLDALWYQFMGWVSGVTAYSITNLIEEWSTASYPVFPINYIKWPATAAGLDTLNHEIARGDSIKRSLISSRDVSAISPAGNEFFTINGDSYTNLILYMALPDTIPNSVTVNSLTPTSLRITWNDRSHSERGFLIIDKDSGNALSDTLPANTETYDLESLSVNTLYNIKVKVVGGTLNGSASTDYDSAYTKANTPGQPTVNRSDSLFNVVVDPNGNPASTMFAIAAQDCTGAWWHVDFRKYPRELRLGQPSPDSLPPTAFHYVVRDSIGGDNGVSFYVAPGKWLNIVTRAVSGN